MIDVKRRLSDSYDIVSVRKILYDNLNYYERLDLWLLFFFFVLGILGVAFTYELRFYFCYLFSYFFIGGFGVFLLINRNVKKRLKAKGIRTSDNLLDHWANEEYIVFKQNLFYESLIDKNILHNTRVDLELIVEYEMLCNDESSFTKIKNGYLYGGGVLLLFILPVWNKIVDLLLKEDKNAAFMSNFKLIVGLIIMVFLMIQFLFFINRTLTEFANRESRKYELIKSMLRDLRLNLKVKYSHRVFLR